MPIWGNEGGVEVRVVGFISFVAYEHAETERNGRQCVGCGGNHAQNKAEHAAEICFVEGLEGMSGIKAEG